MFFCPSCGNMLGLKELEHGNVFSCPNCPYVFPIKSKLVKRSEKQALKEVDDVRGDAELFKHADATDVNCPNCNSKRAYFFQFQTRSADEPMTNFYR